MYIALDTISRRLSDSFKLEFAYLKTEYLDWFNQRVDEMFNSAGYMPLNTYMHTLYGSKSWSRDLLWKYKDRLFCFKGREFVKVDTYDQELAKLADDYMDGLTLGLQGAILKNAEKLQDAVSFEELYVRKGNQGLEGQFRLTFPDGSTKLLDTKSVLAGGWNVQVRHARYLVKVFG